MTDYLIAGAVLVIFFGLPWLLSFLPLEFDDDYE
jgi:hypothetical protein